MEIILVNFLKQFTYLVLAVLGLYCCVGLSLVAASRGLLCICRVQASHCTVFSLQSMGSRASGPQCLWLVGSVVAASRL